MTDTAIRDVAAVMDDVCANDDPDKSNNVKSA